MAPVMAQAPGSDVNEVVINQLEQAYVTPVYVPTPLKTYVPPPWTYCSCVNFVKAYLGVKDEIWGWAARITPTDTEPQIGDVVLTTEGGGHAAVITDIKDGMLSITEANYFSCRVTSRTLPMNSSKIRGYKRIKR